MLPEAVGIQDLIEGKRAIAPQKEMDLTPLSGQGVNRLEDLLKAGALQVDALVQGINQP